MNRFPGTRQGCMFNFRRGSWTCSAYSLDWRFSTAWILRWKGILGVEVHTLPSLENISLKAFRHSPTPPFNI